MAEIGCCDIVWIRKTKCLNIQISAKKMVLPPLIVVREYNVISEYFFRVSDSIRRGFRKSCRIGDHELKKR